MKISIQKNIKPPTKLANTVVNTVPNLSKNSIKQKAITGVDICHLIKYIIYLFNITKLSPLNNP